MSRMLFTAIALAFALLSVSIAEAQEVFRVDSFTIPVPPNLLQQWRVIEGKERWATDRGNRFRGDFNRFVCRQFEVLPANDEAGTPVRVVVTWFRGGQCHRIRRDVYSISDERRRILTRLLGVRPGDVTERRVLQVVFAEFDNCRPLPRREGEGTGEEGEGNPPPPDPEFTDTTAFGSGEEDDPQGEEEGGPNVEGENERPSIPRRHRIPVRFLSGPDRGLLFPFAQMAHQSFQRRLANADCSRVSERDPEEEEETERERERGNGGGDGNERERETEEEENERERETEEEEEQEEGEEEEKERGGRRRFGFVVVRFVAEPGSLVFRRAGRPELVCVQAESPRAALDAVRNMSRFQNVTGPVSVRRVSHTIAPHPPACQQERRRRGGRNEEEEEEQEESLEPTPDPLNVDSDEVQEGIPLFIF